MMKKPREDQKKAIKKTAKELMLNKKAQLIMACGTGKTLTSFWIDMILDNSTTIVFLPSLDLLEQFFVVWSEEGDFEKLIISSQMSKDLEKYGYKKNLNNFLNHKGKRIIFSTYQSVKTFINIKKENNLDLDFIVCDEAHRVAIGEESKLFKLVHDIESKYKLFMTATRKILNKGTFSMNNSDVFGNLSYEYSFGKAIEEGILSDYEIIMMGITKELKELLKNKPYPKDALYSQEEYLQAMSIYLIMKNKMAKKIIVFSERVKIAKHLYNICKDEGLSSYYVDGSMGGEKRVVELNNFKKEENAVIFNARCLVEGIDDSTIDGIYFVNDKKSEISIIQSSSRALRGEPTKTKIAKIFLPMFDNQMELIDIHNSTVLATLINVLEGDSNGDFFCQASNSNFRKKEDGKISFKNKVRFEGFDLDSIQDFVLRKIPKKWFSFNQKYLLILEYLKQRGKIEDSQVIYKSVHLGRFQSDIRKKFKEERLSLEEIKNLHEHGFVFDIEKERQFAKIISEPVDNNPSAYYHPLTKIESFVKAKPKSEMYEIIMPNRRLIEKAKLIIDRDYHSEEMNIYGPLVYSIVDTKVIPLPQEINYFKYSEIQPLLLHLFYDKDVIIGNQGFIKYKKHSPWNFYEKALKYGYEKESISGFKFRDFYHLTEETKFSKISDKEYVIVNNSFNDLDIFYLNFNTQEFKKLVNPI